MKKAGYVSRKLIKSSGDDALEKAGDKP